MIRSFLPLVAAILGGLLAIAIMPETVQAHGILVRSNPADGAVLTDVPQTIDLWFSESISPQFSTSQLLDATGQPVGSVVTRVDAETPGQMTLILPKLAPGMYIVLYNVLSEIDGHFTRGLLVFAYGTDFGPATATEIDVQQPLPEVALRWLNFSGLAALVGASVVLQTILTRAPNSQLHRQGATGVETLARYRVLRWSAGCSVFSLGVGFALLYWQAATLVDGLPQGVLLPNAAWQLLTQTRWGLLWLSRQTILLILVGLAVAKTGGWQGAWSPHQWHGSLPQNRYLEVEAGEMRHLAHSMLALALLVVQALNSHAAGLTFDIGLAIIADTLHLWAASVWVGGLAALAVGILPLAAHDRSGVLQLSWRRFSQLAVVSVGVLAATGIYSMGRQVASLDALLMTLYGRALLAKIVIVLAVGTIGVLNALAVNPMLASSFVQWLGLPSGWIPIPRRQLPYLVIAEICLASLVLLATGFMVATPPPRGLQYATAGSATSLSQVLDDLTITLSAKPNQPGYNVFTIFAASSQRPPPAKIMRVIVQFQHLEEKTQRVSAIAEEVEPGRYLVTGSYLGLPGLWLVEVVIRREGIQDRVAAFRWIVPLPGRSRPVLVSTHPLERPLTITAAMVLLLVLLVLAIGVSRNSAAKWLRLWRM